MERLIQFLLSENTGKRVGILAGLVIGLVIVLLGLLKTLFIVLCMVVGGFVGYTMDHNYQGMDGLKNLFHRKE